MTTAKRLDHAPLCYHRSGGQCVCDHVATGHIGPLTPAADASNVDQLAAMQAEIVRLRDELEKVTMGHAGALAAWSCRRKACDLLAASLEISERERDTALAALAEAVALLARVAHSDGLAPLDIRVEARAFLATQPTKEAR